MRHRVSIHSSSFLSRLRGKGLMVFGFRSSLTLLAHAPGKNATLSLARGRQRVHSVSTRSELACQCATPSAQRGAGQGEARHARRRDMQLAGRPTVSLTLPHARGVRSAPAGAAPARAEALPQRTLLQVQHSSNDATSSTVHGSSSAGSNSSTTTLSPASSSSSYQLEVHAPSHVNVNGHHAHALHAFTLLHDEDPQHSLSNSSLHPAALASATGLPASLITPTVLEHTERADAAAEATAGAAHGSDSSGACSSHSGATTLSHHQSEAQQQQQKQPAQVHPRRRTQPKAAAASPYLLDIELGEDLEDLPLQSHLAQASHRSALQTHQPQLRPVALSEQRPPLDMAAGPDNQPSTSGRHSRPSAAGRVTPARLAALARALRCPVARVQRLLELSPQPLLALDPETELPARLAALREALRLSSDKQAAAIARSQPGLVLQTRLATSRQQVSRASEPAAGPGQVAGPVAVGLTAADRRPDSQSMPEKLERQQPSQPSPAPPLTQPQGHIDGGPRVAAPSGAAVAAPVGSAGTVPASQAPAPATASVSEPAAPRLTPEGCEEHERLRVAAALAARADALAGALGLRRDQLARALAAAPALLRQRPEVTLHRLRRLASLLGLRSPALALRLVAADTQYLTDSYSSLEKRMQELCQLLGKRSPDTVQAAVLRQPQLLCLGTRVVDVRLKTLQSILNKPRRHIVTLVLKSPSLLTADLEGGRQVFEGLRHMLLLKEGSVYAMVCHSPELLMAPLPTLARRRRCLYRAFARCPAWDEEWRSLNPARRADCLMATATTLLRLDFLIATQQAPSLKLVDALRMARSDFSRRWPGFEAALEQRLASLAAYRAAAQQGAAGSGSAGQGAGQSTRASGRRQGGAVSSSPRPRQGSSSGGHRRRVYRTVMGGAAAMMDKAAQTGMGMPEEPGSHTLGDSSKLANGPGMLVAGNNGGSGGIRNPQPGFAVQLEPAAHGVAAQEVQALPLGGI